MKSLTRIKSALTRLHRNEQGAEGLEKLLIIAAVALPLLLVLILFGEQIIDRLTSWWTDVTGESDDVGSNPF